MVTLRSGRRSADPVGDGVDDRLQQRLTAVEADLLQLGHQLGDLIDEGVVVGALEGRQVITVLADARRQPARAHDAFEVAHVGELEFQHGRPPADRVIVVVSRRQRPIAGLYIVAAGVAPTDEVVVGQCVAHLGELRTVPDLGDGPVGRPSRRRRREVEPARGNLAVHREVEVRRGGVAHAAAVNRVPTSLVLGHRPPRLPPVDAWDLHEQRLHPPKVVSLGAAVRESRRKESDDAALPVPRALRLVPGLLA